MCSIPSEWMQFSEPAQHSGITPLASFPVLCPSRLLQPLICWVGESSQRSLVRKITRVQTEGLPCCILRLSVPSQSDLRCFIQVPYFSSQLNFKEWFLPQSESTPCLPLLIINIWKIVSCSTAALDVDFYITEKGCLKIVHSQQLGRRVALPVQQHPLNVSALFSQQ